MGQRDEDEDGPPRVREWVALDLETTGLVAEVDRVVEIGAVRFDATGRILRSFERLVNPGRPMSPAAQAVHGISDADLRDAPPARAVLPEFLDFLGDPATTPLLAHNASFDARFLGEELGRARLPRPGHRVIDTLALSRRRLPDLGNHRLDTLARMFDLDGTDRHRALADCRRVMGLWLRLDGPSEAAGALIAYPLHSPDDPAGDIPLGWDELVAAIAGGLKVRMVYGGGTRGEAPREVTPRKFVHRGGVPYLIAFCHLDAFEKAFRLDRVLRYEVVDVRGVAASRTP